MKKQKQTIKQSKTSDTHKKPKNIKKSKKIERQQDSDQESNFDDDLSSLSELSDLADDTLTESLDNLTEEDYSSDDEQQQKAGDRSQFPKKQFQKQSKFDPIIEEEDSRSLKEQCVKENAEQLKEQNRKRLEELQKIRLQKYLKKPIKDINSVKSSNQSGQNIKLESHEASSVFEEASVIDIQQQSSLNTSSRVKIDDFDSKSNKSFNQSQNPQLLSYLVKIMNGTATPQDLEFRKRQDEKRQKLQDKIKQLQKRKIEQKLKKEYDSRSESEMKILSTNMDSIYEKDQNQSFRFPPKIEMERTKGEINGNEFHKNGRKKRTKVTTDMLRLLIKDFQLMAKQQNGLVTHQPKTTFKEIGRKYKLGRSSVMKMYSDYCKDPTMKRRFESRQPMAHNKSMMELTKRRITFIQKLIRKDCTLSQRQIAAEMNNHDDLKCKRKRRPDETVQEYTKDPYHMVAYKAVSRLMKIGNFTRKKVTLIPKNRNSQRTIEERYNFCKILNELIQDSRNKLYFLDECRFNLFTSRDWGWAPKGELATKVRHNSKGKDVMLLAIIGKQGLVGHQISDSYIRGSFTIAVNKLINNIIPEVVPEGQRIYLILDNCPIHNKDNLKEMQAKKPLTILYLPPYSPMLNPIESWFGELKRIVKSKIYNSRQAMRAEVAKTVEAYKNKSLEHYYKGIEKYIALGLKRQLYRGNNKF